MTEGNSDNPEKNKKSLKDHGWTSSERDKTDDSGKRLFTQADVGSFYIKEKGSYDRLEKYSPKVLPDRDPKEPELSKNKPQEISATIVKIITAIANEESEGLAIIENMQNPEFKLEPDSEEGFSNTLSKAFAVVSKRAISISNQKAAKVSVEKRQETANNFAEGLHDIIEKIKSEENCSTYRQVVDALNKKDILSPNGKKWGTGSLKALYDRWEKLGISGNTPKP